MEKELKEKIFASYLGSVDIKYEGSDVERKLTLPELSICSHVIDKCKIKVNSLKQITDDDAIIAIQMQVNEGYKELKIDSKASDSVYYSFRPNRGGRIFGAMSYENLPFKIYHYLQSQGYALPWRGLSVEDLIKSGVYEF